MQKGSFQEYLQKEMGRLTSKGQPHNDGEEVFDIETPPRQEELTDIASRFFSRQKMDAASRYFDVRGIVLNFVRADNKVNFTAVYDGDRAEIYITNEGRRN